MKNLKFSLVTPEHNPNNVKFLLELYDSIKNQTYTNWEWVLFLNNNCVIENIPDIIKTDWQVKIFRTEEVELCAFVRRYKFGVTIRKLF